MGCLEGLFFVVKGRVLSGLLGDFVETAEVAWKMYWKASMYIEELDS